MLILTTSWIKYAFLAARVRPSFHRHQPSHLVYVFSLSFLIIYCEDVWTRMAFLFNIYNRFDTKEKLFFSHTNSLCKHEPCLSAVQWMFFFFLVSVENFHYYGLLLFHVALMWSLNFHFFFLFAGNSFQMSCS